MVKIILHFNFMVKIPADFDIKKKVLFLLSN